MRIGHTQRPGLLSAGICDSGTANCYCDGKFAPSPLAPPPPPLLLSSGICDSTTASCYCDGKFGFIPPPLGSPPGTPPIRPGRMLGDHCLPNRVSVVTASESSQGGLQSIPAQTGVTCALIGAGASLCPCPSRFGFRLGQGGRRNNM